MDRRRPIKATPAAAGGSDAAENRRLRRAVLDDARRKIERALATADAAEELAAAAGAIVNGPAAQSPGLERADLRALRVALAKYRATRGD
jgi:hypothetical protein